MLLHHTSNLAMLTDSKQQPRVVQTDAVEKRWKTQASASNVTCPELEASGRCAAMLVEAPSNLGTEILSPINPKPYALNPELSV